MFQSIYIAAGHVRERSDDDDDDGDDGDDDDDDDDHGNEKDNTTLHAHHTFLYTSLPSLHDHDVTA